MPTIDAALLLDSDLIPTSDAVEYGNTDLDSATPRITSAAEVRRLFGLSKGVVQLYRYADAADLAANAPPDSPELALGAMVWLESMAGPALNHLQILATGPTNPSLRKWRTLI